MKIDNLFDNFDYEPMNIDYNQLVNTYAGSLVIESTTKVWEELCFLKGIDNEQEKEELAVAFDNIAYRLIYNDLKDEIDYIFNKDAETEIFPVLKLAFTTLKKDGFDFDVDDFIETIKKISMPTVLAIEDLILCLNRDYNDDKDFDFEAEKLVFLVKVIVSQMKNIK